MKIGSNSQSLISLSSLIDATKQQQNQKDEQEKIQVNTRQDRLLARSDERQILIDQNRDALKKIQDDIRVRNLAKLKENSDADDKNSEELNLNLRESFAVKTDQPAFQKLGQLVDIQV